MPVHILLGKPGSGKSLYAMHKLLEQLVDTNRNIVTNLPIKLGELNEYVQKRWPKENTRLLERIRLLSDDELTKFWTFRAPENVQLEKTDGLTTQAAGDGVAYFLDEAHIAFNARDWANVGRGALHYLSQHRKLGDIVFVITQAPGNLDKQFRSIAEDFTVLRNEYTAQYWIFKGRGRITRKTYLSEPQ